MATASTSTIPQFEEKVRAGWLGKVIGGTLGAPFEGWTGKQHLDFYDPVPDQALPNDDLDLQVVWLRHLLAIKADAVRPDDLAQAWQRHVGFPWCEYAVGLRNMHYGLSGVSLGAFDNWFAEGMGAAIRSEIWAFLAAGNPKLAAHYAWCDAIFDHAGDGVYAEIFFAVMEASAFTDNSLDSVLDKGLAAIPPDCRTSFAVRRTRHLWKVIKDWEEVREILVKDFGTVDFTDIAINVALTVLGLLAGEGDFSRTICIANNCGWDTDCTAATAGSILGIMDPKGIPSKWNDPIGGKVVLNHFIKDMSLESDLEELTEQTLRLKKQLTGHVIGDMEVRLRKLPTAAESPIRVPYRFGTLDCFIADLEGVPTRPTAGFAAPGHWFRHSVGNKKAKALHFSFDAKIAKEEPVRFMAYMPRPVRVFVDGKHYADWEPRSWAPGWHSPSFHMYAERSVDGTKPQRAPAIVLPPGVHQFDVFIDHDGTDAAELVAGVDSAGDDLWLPFALAEKA